MSNRTYSIIGLILLMILTSACAINEPQSVEVSDLPIDEGTEESTASEDFHIIYPTYGVISQGFAEKHLALDFTRKDDSIETQPILAAATGTVTEVSTGTWHEGDGNYLAIDHGNGVQTTYSHLEEVFVNLGDTVTQGQEIANMGNTGRVYGDTGINLHFELWMDGELVNPMDYFVSN